MIALANKFTLWSLEGLLNVPAFPKAKPQQSNGHPVLPSPLRQTLCFAGKLYENLRSFYRSISEFRFGVECLLYGPPSTESPRQGWYTKLPRPIGNGLGNPLIRDVDVGLEVALLRSGTRPPAIFFEVAKCSIFTVYGGVGRALSHVGKEVYKRLSPPIANVYSNRPVLGVLRRVFTVAPCDHVLVGVVGDALAIDSRAMAVFFAARQSAVMAAIKRLPFINPVFFGLEKSSATNAVSVNKVFACHALIIANKTRVAGVSVELPGLTKRRAMETELCLRGVA